MRREGAAALPTSRCQIEDHPVDHRYPEGGRRLAASIIAGRLPNNAVLHGQISRLLVSDEVHRRTHHETSGRLDRRALVRMGTGAVDVFSRRDDTPGINTAVLVLIDGSGSMSHPVGAHRRDTIAQTAAWHIAMAAEDADAKICVAAFYTAAFNGADVYTVKPWDVSMRDRAVTLEHTVGATSTPLAPAIIGAARLFDQVTQATRRIMIVLTDGQCDYGANAVRSACNVAAQLGVEVVGLGMDCAEVVDAFPPRYSLNVTNVEQLATTGLGVLCGMLEDAAGAGAD
jgi:Mg-chelatase subunit ChlD